ncbi:MAG: hypothetical protein Q9196_006560 [Gyalolechia fulgens]
MDANVSLDDNSYRVMIAVGFAIGITCVAIALRLLARRIQKVPLGADDFVILAGAVFTIGTAATYAGYQTYGVAVTLIKLSILLFYRRIFSTSQFRLRTNIVGALVIAWLFINNLASAFQCRLIIGFQAGNLTLDIVILSLPVYAVSQLQMSRSKRISVLAIFLLGALSVVIAAIRIVILATADTNDVTCNEANFLTPIACSRLTPLGYSSIESWTAVEPAIEVLSVSLPCMAPFLHGRKAFKDIRSSLRSFLSNSKRSDLKQDGDFQKIDKHRKMMFDVERAGQDNGGRTFATAESRMYNNLDDTIPLHAIKVTDEVDIHKTSRL